MKKTAVLCGILFFHTAICQQPLTPDRLYGPLFTEVQLRHVFADNKTFVDCVPKKAPALIRAAFRTQRTRPGFSLKAFVEQNFTLPPPPPAFAASPDKDLRTHIQHLWQALKRQNDTQVKGSSLLPLPYPYIVPGGRFREIYYWDSYFTFLGLKESGETETIENMVRNFAWLLNNYGHIPNGNRTYYLSRSQPPYFSLMLDVLASLEGNTVYRSYRKELKKEYDYWMDRSAPTRHVVRMPDGSLLNRYYDQENIPRQESYSIDIATQKAAPSKPQLFRNLRAAAESGWDFSSRWFADGQHLASIQTLNLIPVDLNCLLYHLELTLARACREDGGLPEAWKYQMLAEKRKTAINKYCWSAKYGWYTDYNFVSRKHSPEITLAGMVPFFLKVAPYAHIFPATENIRLFFLQPGGVVTSLRRTGEQWDAPNGWAPLEWMTITGLENYEQQELARSIASRWIRLNRKVYENTGRLMEKYNVADTSLPAGGGEYPSQDGFGWTNGVLLALLKKYGD